MKKIHMIGNTHFDPVWLWKWDEAMSSITATFRSALERMKEYPEFKYSFATPPVFEWIKNTDPELFEEIKKRVQEGRWELAEGWWVQPDCYSGSGESYVRQGLYGQKYLKDNFGMVSDTVFNIDSFGHPSTLPQILSKSGIKYYVFCRPEGRHVELEKPLFNWKSADGSTVLTYRDDAPYKPDTAEAIEEMKDSEWDSLMVYGVTDHGGAPTKKSLEEIRKSPNAECSTVGEFFEGRTADYTVTDEFITGDFGVYVNNPGIKALNRKAEYAVMNAEKASVIADNYDGKKIRECWQDILFNQFHDILGGASIKDAYFDAENMYGRAIATANEIMHYNLLRVTNKIRMPGSNSENEWNLAVWNLNGDKYDGYIEAEVQWVHEFPWYDKGIVLEDSEGKRYPCQIIREKSVIPRFRSRFLFKAEIPALGYKTFKVLKTGEDVSLKVSEPAKVLKTEKYTIAFSESGGIEAVTENATGKMVAGNLLYPAAFEDDGDTWAFNIEEYGKRCEDFKLKRLELTEEGELRTVIKATYTFRDSKCELYYGIYHKESYIDVKYRVNWNEKHLVLKLMTEVDEAKHKASIPYGWAERGETKADVPVGEWLETKNLIFAADSIFAYNLADNKLGLSVLRSPIYGDLRIEDIDLDTDYDIVGQGITEGNIRVSFDKNISPCKLASDFNNQPIVLCEANHGGEKAGEGSILSVQGESVNVTVLKKAEEKDALIIRGMEYAGEPQKVKITVMGVTYEADVEPYEIFTLCLKGNELKKVNMIEDM